MTRQVPADTLSEDMLLPRQQFRLQYLVRHWKGLVALVVLLVIAYVVLVVLPRGSGLPQNCTRGQPCEVTDPAKPPLKELSARVLTAASSAAASKSILPVDQARARNDAVDFASGPVTPAPAFRFVGSADDRARARECLATAMLYEAGRDARGQRAVAQVILNRVRHVAYPDTVCGVVYQGSERPTGCQFTFSCDGALRRIQPKNWMDEARALADEALNGAVFKAVGLATHYHTDWVYPYWSASLDKIAAVDTHLFFRWRNYLGSRASFTKQYRGGEPMPRPIARVEVADDIAMALPAEAQVTAVSDIVRAPLIDLPPPPHVPAAALRGNVLKLVHPQGGAYVLLLRGEVRGEDHIGVALRLCRDEPLCHVMGWIARDKLPRSFPVPPDNRAALSFSYFRDCQTGREEVRFDCKVYPRADARQCLLER